MNRSHVLVRRDTRVCFLATCSGIFEVTAIGQPSAMREQALTRHQVSPRLDLRLAASGAVGKSMCCVGPQSALFCWTNPGQLSRRGGESAALPTP